MGICPGVQTLLGDIGATPVCRSLEGKLSVAGCSIVSVLGRVVADVVSAAVPVHAIDPFPYIAPEVLDTSVDNSGLTVCARRSAGEVGNAVARPGSQRAAVSVTISSANNALHIVVCKLHQHEHLNGRHRRNVNQAPSCALRLGVTAESGSCL